ncbi:hypothetical protein H8K90_14295 [Winogradskyella echinorum]|uniref:Uncharacterized protein n=1 Tax=Winogradskyella echinorum TaxID=538189 RepID=A0ABR6Y4G9_9FLAO|nr:hypothetical protein [Winogradskyella echinorum]MBC3847564.1 hypothetical protein [Winogradskyella echinorum]MBC5751912.1 hypothetical protein [Winogradskyella echinorum]
MKYYSYIDELNLGFEEFINLSPYKLKEIINQLSEQDTQYKTSIIRGIEDSVSRSYHLTIEKNIWLKNILFKRFEALKKNQIELNLEYIDYISGFKLFLELYIRPILPNLINQLIEKNELKLLFNILSQSDLFSKNCEKDIIGLLHNKVDYGVRYLNQNQINNPDEEIKYIKSYLFYEILNLYEPHFKEKLINLYDSITTISDQFDDYSNDPLFRYVSQAQVAFRKSQIDDVATKLVIDNNAENAKEYAYKYASEIKPSTSKSSYKRYQDLISIIGITTFVIILSTVAFNSLQKSDVEEKSFQTENYDTKKKRTTYDNRIRFYYSLKRITKKAKKTEVSTNEIEVQPFSNPFPKTFNLIANDTTVSNNTNVQIANKTNSDLIVFKMIKGVDESIYIPQAKTIYISLNPSDSLLFYSGTKFITSNLSNFKEDMVISDVYKVDKIDDASVSTINITPIDSLNKFKKRLISKEHIKTTDNIKLRKISLDNLYRIYYSKYAN